MAVKCWRQYDITVSFGSSRSGYSWEAPEVGIVVEWLKNDSIVALKHNETAQGNETVSFGSSRSGKLQKWA